MQGGQVELVSCSRVQELSHDKNDSHVGWLRVSFTGCVVGLGGEVGACHVRTQPFVFTSLPLRLSTLSSCTPASLPVFFFFFWVNWRVILCWLPMSACLRLVTPFGSLHFTCQANTQF